VHLNHDELKDFLDEKSKLYNTKSFIEQDPVSIPHRYTRKEDIEISGFLAATIAWGQRATILKNMQRLMMLMDDAPFEFITHSGEKDRQAFSSFVHRTFNGADCIYFIKGLQHIYTKHGGLENIFVKHAGNDADLSMAMHRLKEIFFELPHPARSRKHIADPLANSSAKRINMFLRWMVRSDNAGVDFGLWKKLGVHRLSCPLDIHSGRVARKLGLLERKQNDWKAVVELTANLKKFDARDPVKYDFALFGLGVNEKF
jgi:uncharacterized protein (TIGR02757 family)